MAQPDSDLTDRSPIAVLDSGLGGLTVVRALRAVMPACDIVYFGDTARLPYGAKAPDTVTGFVRQIIQHLLPLGPRHVVIACNTATALALPAMVAEFPHLSISGVIEPGAKAAVIAAGAVQQPVIGVLATEATVQSKAYVRAVIRRRHHARVVMQPAPLLVPIIEEGRSERDPLVRLALKQYLGPLMDRNPDVLVLGCTHYPVLKGLISRLVGPGVQVIDSAMQCADDVRRRLHAAGLSPQASGSRALTERGQLRCIVTDDPARFTRLAPRFLGEPVNPPRWVSADELYRPSLVQMPASSLRAVV